MEPSRADVDQERIAVWGGSQGGGLAFATTSLDRRIDLYIAVIPFLCHWVNYFKLTHWPEVDGFPYLSEQRAFCEEDRIGGVRVLLRIIRFQRHPSDLVVSGQTERVERAGHLFLQEQDAAGANVDAAT